MTFVKCSRVRCTYKVHRSGLCAQHYLRSRRGFVDAQPVRDRLDVLHASGLAWDHIAEKTGLTRHGIDLIRRGVAPRVRVSTWDRIMALPLGGDGLVDATGTRRRVQALSAAGWSQRMVADMLGMEQQHISHMTSRAQIFKRKADAVAELFERLQMTPGPSCQSRAHAHRKGWPPPFAWDEDDIDNPLATADTGGKSTWLQRYEDYRSTGLTDAEVAAAMGIQLESLRRQLERKAA